MRSSGLAAKRTLEGGELGFDISFDLPPLDDVLAIAAQEVVDGFDPDADGAGRLVLVEILEGEVGVPDCSMMPSMTP